MVAEGRGESEYLCSKYSEIPDFLLKIGKNPSDPVAPDFTGATGSEGFFPVNKGGKGFFDTLTPRPNDWGVYLQFSVPFVHTTVVHCHTNKSPYGGVNCSPSSGQ